MISKGDLEVGGSGWRGGTNLCISDADVLMPRHRSSTTPARATHSKNLVLVKKAHTALVGGRLFLATFQLMPPFGRSIFKQGGWPATPPKKRTGGLLSRPSSAQVSRDASPCGRVVRGADVSVSEAAKEWHTGGLFGTLTVARRRGGAVSATLAGIGDRDPRTQWRYVGVGGARVVEVEEALKQCFDSRLGVGDGGRWEIGRSIVKNRHSCCEVSK